MNKINYGIYKGNSSARSIIKGWVAKAEKPMNKYNPAFIRAVEEWIGMPASDYREGSDTGMEMERDNKEL